MIHTDTDALFSYCNLSHVNFFECYFYSVNLWASNVCLVFNTLKMNKIRDIFGEY